MDKTYEEIIKLVADRVYLGSDKDDFDNGELSGAAFVISRMFGKTIVSVKKDIKEIGN